MNLVRMRFFESTLLQSRQPVVTLPLRARLSRWFIAMTAVVPLIEHVIGLPSALRMENLT